MRDDDCYDKPIWTLRSLARVLPELPALLQQVWPTLRGELLSHAERERIMLAVAAENRCRYCQAAHTYLGRAAGLSVEDIALVLARGDSAELDRAERLALRYVRDLAARDFESCDPELQATLAAEVGSERLQAIEASARVMNFANRFGNTFDALLTRLRGRCDASGAGWLDLGVVSLAFLIGAAAAAGPLLVGILALPRLTRS